MLIRSSRVRVLLSVGLLCMLVLGIVARPMLDRVTGLHALEHRALTQAALAADAHPHPHSLDDHPTPQSPDEEPGHAQGSHGLLHQADATGSISLLPMLPPYAAASPASTMMALRIDGLTQHLSGSPFRPPIV